MAMARLALVFPPLFSALLLLSRPIRQCARLCPTQSLSPVISARPGRPQLPLAHVQRARSPHCTHAHTHAPYYAAPISDGGPARIRTRDALTLSHETHHLQRTILTCDHISPTSPPPKTLRPAFVSTGCPRSRRRRRSLRSRPARSIPWQRRRGSPCRPRPSRPDLPASSPRSCARLPRRRRGACRRR